MRQTGQCEFGAAQPNGRHTCGQGALYEGMPSFGWGPAVRWACYLALRWVLTVTTAAHAVTPSRQRQREKASAAASSTAAYLAGLLQAECNLCRKACVAFENLDTLSVRCLHCFHCVRWRMQLSLTHSCVHARFITAPAESVRRKSCRLSGCSRPGL